MKAGDWVIDRDVPFPKQSTRGLLPKYPWDRMQPGDSIALPFSEFNAKQRKAARKSAYDYMHRHKCHFESREVIERDRPMLRIWRIR